MDRFQNKIFGMFRHFSVPQSYEWLEFLNESWSRVQCQQIQNLESEWEDNVTYLKDFMIRFMQIVR